jgi:hypothetical protein
MTPNFIMPRYRGAWAVQMPPPALQKLRKLGFNVAPIDYFETGFGLCCISSETNGLRQL